jgi:hypothetical protein
VPVESKVMGLGFVPPIRGPLYPVDPKNMYRAQDFFPLEAMFPNHPKSQYMGKKPHFPAPPPPDVSGDPEDRSPPEEVFSHDEGSHFISGRGQFLHLLQKNLSGHPEDNSTPGNVFPEDPHGYFISAGHAIPP